MKIFPYILLFLIIICIIKCESKACPKDIPFLSSDIVCSNFSDICIKSDDECKRLLSACDQCPPSNLTISYLRELIKTAKETSNSTRFIYVKLEKILENKFEFLKVNIFNGQKNMDKNFEILLPICILILIVLFVVIIIMLLENRFKLFTKCCDLVINEDLKNKYKLLQSRKQLRKTKNNINSNNYSNWEVDDDGIPSRIFLNNLQTQINEIKEAVLKSNSFMEKMDDKSRKIQFKIIGENKPIELYIHRDDSVVYVKDLICSECTKLKGYHYKIMKLKCDENEIKNNDYLLSQIPIGRDIVKCEIDDCPDEKNILVLQIKGIYQRNAFLQVNKEDKINNLKDIIKNLINNSDFSIFSKNGENFTELIDDNPIENYHLNDKDFIQIVFKKKLNLNIQSIFDSKATLPVECCITNKVEFIYSQIKNTLLPPGLILIMNSQCLERNNYIFQYGVSSDSPIKYCRFNTANHLKINKEIDNKGDVVLATNLIKKMEILVKKFFIPVENNFKTNPAFIKELSTFDILKSREEFVQLDEPFFDSEFLYVSMEYMEKGSLKDFLESRNKKGDYVNEDDIKNWSMQIVEALNFLHNNKIIHRNLKTSNILLYGENRLKLSNFGLSKYLHDIDLSDAVKGFMQTNYQLSRHLAPEMKGNNYGNKIDIWSFGIVLLEMNNGESIFPGFNDLDAVKKLGEATKNEDIKYILREDTSDSFKGFIKCCLEIDPEQRSTAEKLKEHKFLK